MLGGALAGAGDALEKRADDARKERLLELEAQYGERQDSRRFDQQKTLEQMRLDASNNDIQSTVTDTEGNLVGITKSGTKKDLNVKAGKPTDTVKEKLQDQSGNWYGVTESGKTVDLGIRGKPPKDDSSEPLQEISDPNSPTGSSFVTRSNAIGKPGKGRVESAGDLMVPILKKIANGEPVTADETKAWEMYTKMDPIKQAIAKALQGGQDAGSGDVFSDTGTPGAADAGKPRGTPSPPIKPSLAAGGRPTPRTQKEFDALPKGAIYIDPDDGKPYRKP